MSRCFQCTAKFGFFRHEHDCKNCGKSFCSSCLPFRVAVPKYGGKVQAVCQSCYKTLTRVVSEDENPPSYTEAISGAQISAQEPTSDVSIVAPVASKPDPDAEIRDRLQNLKDSDQTAGNKSTSDADSGNLDERFEALTGRVPQSAQKSDILTPKPKLTETEEISLLLEKVTEEAKLEDKIENANSKPETTDDLEKRLLHLQGIDPDKVKQATNDNESSEDEYEAAGKILRKALQEAAIDDKVKASGYGDLITEDAGETVAPGLTLPGVPGHIVGAERKPSLLDTAESDDEELPWCCICNADARVRCHGCDDDLYCRKCFKEGHRGEDMEEHTTSVFKAKGTGKH